jgi:SAM-dependent methyltransferase
MTATDHATTVAPPPDAFRFGRNWRRYVSTYLDAGRERVAAESLRDLVGDLDQRSFLDVGCGSGLFSMCAYRAGAVDVVSIDVDPDAVTATRELETRAGAPTNWRILHQSILAPDILAELEPADVVYSWGVLHHTGDMYTAIRNAAALVKPGGRFAIAIYNRVTGRWLDSKRWWQNECRQARGMALWTDLVDWLGGYPYEFATPEEIIDFCEGSCGLRSIKTLRVEPRDTGNNQFVFERPVL